MSYLEGTAVRPCSHGLGLCLWVGRCTNVMFKLASEEQDHTSNLDQLWQRIPHVQLLSHTSLGLPGHLSLAIKGFPSSHFPRLI